MQDDHTFTLASISWGLHCNLNTTHEHFKNDKFLEIYVQLTDFAFEQPKNCRSHKSEQSFSGHLTLIPSHLLADLY